MRIAIVLTVSLVLGACIPQHLRKYRGGSRSNPSFQESDVGPTNGIGQQARSSGSKKSPQASKKKSKSRRASIYAIDQQTYRFNLSESRVWEAVLNVLLRNYNLTIVDKDSGIVTTEWDTFYLNEGVFRNKLSLRVIRSGRGITDVIVHNNTEKLQSGAAGAVGSIWLPAEATQNEEHRIVQNMAIALNEPPPILPKGDVAIKR